MRTKRVQTIKKTNSPNDEKKGPNSRHPLALEALRSEIPGPGTPVLAQVDPGGDRRRRTENRRTRNERILYELVVIVIKSHASCNVQRRRGGGTHFDGGGGTFRAMTLKHFEVGVVEVERDLRRMEISLEFPCLDPK